MRLPVLALSAVLASLALTYESHAQSWQWVAAAQGSGYADLISRASVVDNQGNMIIAGNLNGAASFGSTSLSSTNLGDGFVAKVNDQGQWQWAIKYPVGNGSQSYFTSAVADGQGNLYFAGSLVGTATFGSTTITGSVVGSGQMLVAKINSAGQWQWAVTTPTTGASGVSSAQANDIAIDPVSGNLVVVGRMAGTVAFGSTSLSNPTNDEDGVVAKLASADGAWQWAKAIHSTSNDEASAVQIDGAGNMYVGATYQDPITLGTLPSLVCAGGRDILVAKLSAAGDWVWAQRAGARGNEVVTALGLDNAGNIKVGGTYDDDSFIGSTSLRHASGLDIYVATLDPAGNWTSAVVAKGEGRDEISDLYCDPSGNVLITGSFNYNLVMDGDTAHPGADFYMSPFVASLSPSNTWSWHIVAPGSSGKNARSYGMAIAPPYAYIAGSYMGSCQFGSTTLPDVGNNNKAYVARLSSVLATKPLLSSSLAVSPNPASSRASVFLPAGMGFVGTAPATLFDASGRSVGHYTFIAGQPLELDLSGLATGIYNLVVYGERNLSARFVKE